MKHRGLTLALLVAFSPAAMAAMDAQQCVELGQNAPHGTKITRTAWFTGGKLPADAAAALTGSAKAAANLDFVPHCEINGEMEHRTGVDGKPYHIGFQLRLPAH